MLIRHINFYSCCIEWSFRKEEDRLIKDHHYLIKRHTGKKTDFLLKIHEEELKEKHEMYNINKEVDLFMTDEEETNERKNSMLLNKHFQKIRSIMERKCKEKKSQGCLIKRYEEELGKQGEMCIISKELDLFETDEENINETEKLILLGKYI